MAINLTSLKQELLDDPKALGYAEFVSARNDVSLADILNLVRDDSDYVIPRGRITKDEFLELTTQMVFNLMLELRSGNTNAQFWLDVFDRLVANSDTINCNDAAISSILDQMRTENLILPSSISLIKNKSGSRAEVLFGCNVTVQDISNSLNEVEI